MIDAGYWIGGFGLGEGIDERPALLRAIVVSAITVVVQ